MVKTFVIGVGMTRFERPGTRDWDYPEMGSEAAAAALADAGIQYGAVETAYMGYANGDSTSGQRALFELGLTGIPAINVNNACATGSSALHLARSAVRHGMVDCALALGFEKMQKGSLQGYFTDRAVPSERYFVDMATRRGFDAAAPATVQLFAHVAREYMEQWGVDEETFAIVAAKNSRHAVHNPNSQFQIEHSVEDVRRSPMIFDPLTKLQCCPTSDGGAAAVIASERFVDEHGLRDRAVEIAGQAMRTDLESSFDGSDRSVCGFHTSRAAALAAYEEAGVGADEAQVVELHDCFSAAEVMFGEAIGLYGEGEAADLIHDGGTTHGGKVVVNPSGGLLSKGHPLGATGLAQCAELTWQLRGEAGRRQVANARVGVQHNAGLGGAVVVSVYRGPEA